MGKFLLLSRSNWKKNKKRFLSSFLLIILAGALMSLALLSIIGYQANFDTVHNEMNDGHVNVLIAGHPVELAKYEDNYLKTSDAIEAYSSRDVVPVNGSCQFGDNMFRMLFVVMNKEDTESTTTGCPEIVIDSDAASGIYLPYQFYQIGFYGVGDDFSLIANEETVIKCKVAGFFTSPMCTGSRSKMSALILTDDLFNAYREQNPIPAKYVSIRVDDCSGADRFEYDVITVLEDEYPTIQYIASNNIVSVKTTTYAKHIICCAIIGIAAIVLCAVSMAVVGFSIVSLIKANMKNFSMLKALGYKSGFIRGVLIIQFGFISLLASLIGTGISYLVFPKLDLLIELTTEIIYPIKFELISFIIVNVSLLLLTTLTAWLSSSKIKKLTPITAIRNTSKTGAAMKNHFPLSKSVFGVHGSLAFKTAAQSAKQNLIITLTYLGIIFGITFSVVMYDCTIKVIYPAVELTANVADSLVSISKDDRAEFEAYLKSSPDVSSALVYMDSYTGLCNNEHAVRLQVIDNGSNVTNSVFNYRGRLPQNENEVSVGALYAKDAGINIGDTVEISLGSKTHTYTVSGLSQLGGRSGNDCVLSIEGFEHLKNVDELTYLITLGQDPDISDFNMGVKEQFPEAVTENYRDTLDGYLYSFKAMITFVVYGIVFCCVSVSVTTVFILVKTLMSAKEKEYGILKALGYTTADLLGQTILSFVPVILFSMLIGVPLLSSVINLVISTFIHSVGVVESRFFVDVLKITGFTGILAAFTLALVCIFSLSIRKNTPEKLISGR